jgi:hypothetical protein
MTSVTHCDYCDTVKRETNHGGWRRLETHTAYHEGGAPICLVSFDLCGECAPRTFDLRMMLKRGLAQSP